jgi:hypothetical protein
LDDGVAANEDAMAIYTVHEPPLKAGESTHDPERFVFVRDGFSFWAFLLAPLWMLRHRLWLVFVGYLVVVAVLQAGLRLVGAPTWVMVTVAALLALLVGFEAATLRRFTLARRRWKKAGIVVGDDLESAERRFFDAWVSREPDRWWPAQPLVPAARRPQPQSEVIGLFPQSGVPR